MFNWHYPPVDGSSTILLVEFTDDIISLTTVPEKSIEIRLREEAIGLRYAEKEKND